MTNVQDIRLGVMLHGRGLPQALLTMSVVAAIGIVPARAGGMPPPTVRAASGLAHEGASARLASPMDGTNLLQNGGFETGQQAPWAAYHAIVTITTQAHSGSYALQAAPWHPGAGLYYIVDYANGNPFGLVPHGIVAAQPGTYLATVWVRGVVGRTMELCVRDGTASQVNGQNCDPVTATGGWQTLTVAHTVVIAGNNVDLWVGGEYYQQGDMFTLDDASLSTSGAPQPTPTTASSPTAASATATPTPLLVTPTPTAPPWRGSPTAMPSPTPPASATAPPAPPSVTPAAPTATALPLATAHATPTSLPVMATQPTPPSSPTSGVTMANGLAPTPTATGTPLTAAAASHAKRPGATRRRKGPATPIAISSGGGGCARGRSA